MSSRAWIATLAAWTGAACTMPARGEDPFGAGTGGPQATDGADDDDGDDGVGADETGSAGEAEGTDGMAGDGQTPKLDVGAPSGTGGAACVGGDGDCGCSAVDVLFVIDNSGSMCSFQDGLAQAFPSFVDAMYEALPPGTDLHVGITTSGFEVGGSHSESNCVAAETPATIDQYYTRPTEGNVAGGGLQGRLLPWEGQSFYAVDTGDPAGKPALTSWFSGAATSVGCGVSSFEFNASAAAWALHPANAATNDGFLRDEGAVLVIFILSDEADQSLDMESLEFLHDTVVDAKSACGGDSCVVTGGLLGPWCIPDQNAAYDFLASFGSEPIWGDIWGGNIISPDVDSYVQTVGDAFAQVVAQTCESIPPVG